MSANTPSKDKRTLGYVARRTNYGEADRILNVITPQGKISVIAKGVRRDKSKLAGGVEMFALTELDVRFGRGELGVVAGAKLIVFYSNLLKDLAKVELAALILKKVSILAENSDNLDYFEIVDQSLRGLNLGLQNDLVEAWVLINLLKAAGEELNLYRDVAGAKLLVDQRYNYDATEKAMVLGEDFGAEEIKLLRLMSVTRLEVVARVKGVLQILPKVLWLARIASGEV